MSSESIDLLKKRILDLEEEVREREKDLSVFRRELSQANRRLEALISELNQDLKLVHALQKKLVPTEIPHIPGFEFSSKFVPSFVRGGDYFDVFEHEDRSHFGMIVASASGHMMSALLLSVLLRLSGQMEARRGDSSDQMLKKIVNELHSTMSDKDSADLFYGVFDRRSFSLEYSKLGDIVALHHDYAKNELRLLKTENPALTKVENIQIQKYTVPLNSRDKLIFCTKGVIETKNLEGLYFGQERLFKTVLESVSQGVHELRNSIFFQTQQFSAGQEPPRDLTVVVAEVKDKVIKLAKK